MIYCQVVYLLSDGEDNVNGTELLENVKRWSKGGNILLLLLS